MLQLLLIAFIGIAAVNLTYFFLYGIFLFTHKEKNLQAIEKVLPVSLIICVKNEAFSLRKNLPVYLSQSHPDYEIILINDTSTDDTLEVMEEFQKNDTRIKIVNVQNNERFWGNKKYALTLGIKKASHSHLVFTEVNCKPQGKDWLRLMAAQFTPGKQMVLGYGAYEAQKSFLNKMIRYETLLTATQYFSYATTGNPYMGVGRNLAYTSKIFYDNNGFVEHMNILSDNADLFVNAVATAQNTNVLLNKNAFTKSEPKQNWKDWYKEKRMQVSTSKHYQLKHKILLRFFFISQILFWVLAILLQVINFNFIYWIAAFAAIKVIAQYIIVGKASKRFNEKGLLWLMPIQEIVLLSTQLFIFIHNKISKPIHGE